MKKVGATNGVITIEEGKTAETAVTVVQGCSSTAATCRRTSSTTPKRHLRVDNPYILIFEEKSAR